MNNVFQDLRYGIRQLARAPTFTVVAVLTLGLGIGGTTAIVSAIDAVLLSPLPFSDADRVVTLWQSNASAGVERDDVSPANFLDWRERSQSFEVIAAADPFSFDYVGPDGPEELRSWQVTEGFFDVFGVPARLGSTLRPEHYANRERVVVLSDRTWRGRFGGDPQVLGRTLLLDGVPMTVIGVMPPKFEVPAGRGMWVPYFPQGFEPQARGDASWSVVGKLKAGESLASAQAELDGIAAQLAQEYPATNAGLGISAVAIADSFVEDYRPALLLFLGAVALVLLIACVNIANLLLARSASRSRELAIRAVVGAGRARVIRQLVTESLLLAVLSALTGLVIAGWALSAFQPFRPEDLPHADTAGIDGRVIAFACLLALGTAVLFGLLPAVHAARANLNEHLRAGVSAALPAAWRFRAGLVVAELALAMVLLISAGLLLRSFVTLLDTERGYRTENILALTVQAWTYYPTPEQRGVFVEQALERIGALPGVLDVGVASSMPLRGAIGADTSAFTIPSLPSVPQSTAHTVIATDGYFRALGIALLAGRSFGPDDDADAPPVVLINETMASRYWAGDDPIGTRIDFRFSGREITAEVVGVVADMRQQPEEEPRPSLFMPYGQNRTGALHFTARVARDPATFVREAQNAIWALEPNLPFAAVATLDGLLDDSLRARRFTLQLLLAFAVTALVLAAVGTYGVLAYDASRRTREIGVRIALGAEKARVVWQVVGEGLRLALIGIAIGTVLAIAVARFITTFLYGVTSFDPLTFVGIALMLLAVTAIASYLPARRAALVDPLVSLRAE